MAVLERLAHGCRNMLRLAAAWGKLSAEQRKRPANFRDKVVSRYKVARQAPTQRALEAPRVMRSLPEPDRFGSPQDVAPAFAKTPANLFANPRIGWFAKCLYGHIAGNHIDFDTRAGVVSRQQLADELGVGLTSIRCALAELKRADVLVIRHRKDAAGNKLASEFFLPIGQKTARPPRAESRPTLGSNSAHQRSDLKIREEKKERAAPRAKQPAWRPPVPGFNCDHAERCDTRHACLARSLADARDARAAAPG